MLYPDSVTIKPYVSEDKYQKITYGTSYTANCQYQKSVENVVSTDGSRELVNVAWCLFPPTVHISTKDQILLPDGSTSYNAIIDKITDHLGNDVNVLVYLTKRMSKNE